MIASPPRRSPSRWNQGLRGWVQGLAALRAALASVFGRGALELPHASVGSLPTAHVVGALAPVAQVLLRAQPGAGLDHLAHGVTEQVDVGGEVHIGFDHGRSQRARRARPRAVFYQRMPRVDYHLIDPIEHLGGEQAQVVFERQHAPALLLGPVAVAEHAAHCAMLIGQFLDAFVVGIEPQTQRPEYQHLPLRHARTPGLGADDSGAVAAQRDDLSEDREDPLAQLGRDVDGLESAQQAREVIARPTIDLDRADVLLAELQLGRDDPAHGARE